MFEIEWDSQGDQRRYKRKASTIHGWVTKLRGTLLDNEAIRRAGIREMRDAKLIRKYKKERRVQKRGQSSGHSGLLSIFTKSKTPTRKVRRSHSTKAVVVHRDSSRRRMKATPLLHSPHRTKSSHHGRGTMIRGYVTNNKDHISKGKSMQSAASKERSRERRRRSKQRQREALAMRVDARRR